MDITYCLQQYWLPIWYPDISGVHYMDNACRNSANKCDFVIFYKVLFL